MKRCEALPDPCPSPAQQAAIAKATGQTGRKRLDEKDKKLHAPFSDRQGLKIEGSAIWINREKGFNFDKDAPEDGERGLGEEMIIGLQSGGRVLGQTDNGLQLFSSGDHLVKAMDDDVGDSGRRARGQSEPWTKKMITMAVTMTNWKTVFPGMRNSSAERKMTSSTLASGNSADYSKNRMGTNQVMISNLQTATLIWARISIVKLRMKMRSWPRNGEQISPKKPRVSNIKHRPTVPQILQG